jgi:hypothetical protein
MIRVESICIYSCLADTAEEASHVRVEVRFSDGGIAEGEMTPEAASALALSISRAAEKVRMPRPAPVELTAETCRPLLGIR